MDRSSPDYQILLRTVYGEARGEPFEGQLAVAWVIKNRADMNRGYWGGCNIADVCRHRLQFECWNGKSDICMDETAAVASIEKWLDRFYEYPDPTGGADHFHNPKTEPNPSWKKNCRFIKSIGNHDFYKGP